MNCNRDLPLITKIMSLTFDDFTRGMAVLAGKDANSLALRAAPVRLPLDHGHVELEYQELPEEQLGGLLELPRAKVVLRFLQTDTTQAEAFVKRFDQAFRRGGG